MTDPARSTLLHRHRFGAMVVEKHRLPNGLSVLLLPDSSAPIVSLQMWYRVGSRHERPGKTGIAHLFEHLMFNQTENLPAGEFDRLMESAGGDSNAATWVDWTYYRDSLPSARLDLALRLEAERMQFLTLEEGPLESEREVVINERRYRVEDDVDGFLAEQLFALAFPGHPYGWPTIGWMADIQAITLEDARTFYRTYYAPNAATLVLAGDFTVPGAMELIEEHFGPIAASELPPEAPPRAPTPKERRLVFRKPVSADRALLAWRAPAQGDPDWLVMEFVHEVLLGGPSSVLHRRLTIEEEIATHASGHVSPFRDPGLFEISLSMKRGHQAGEAELIVREELSRLRTGGVEAEALERARNRLETSFWSALETADGRAEALGHYETVLGDYRRLFETAQRIAAVSADDVQRVAHSYLDPDAALAVVAEPTGEEDGGDGDEEGEA